MAARPKLLPTWLSAILVALLLAAGRTGSSAEPEPRLWLALLDSETPAPGRAMLKLIILNAGKKFPADTEALVTFASPDDPNAPFEAPGTGFRTTRVPVRSSAWAADHTEVVPFGPFTLTADTPRDLEVRGGLVGQPLVLLGTLVGEERDGRPRVTLRRACAPRPEGERRVIAVAACEFVADDRLVVKVGFFNCGERFERDYWAFLHFEPEPTGEDHSVTSEMGLHPAAQPTDSSSWSKDEVTVVTFGPYTLPRDLDAPVYVRAGLYDRDGDGQRVPLAASGDRQRVLVGRIVPTGDGARFERMPVPPMGALR